MNNKFYNFIEKIKNWFNRIFNIQPKMLNEGYHNNNENTNEVELMKRENKINQTTEEIVSLVEKYPETLYRLNNRQLDVIEKYYNKKTIEIEKQVNAIEKNINNLKDANYKLSNALKILNNVV